MLSYFYFNMTEPLNILICHLNPPKKLQLTFQTVYMTTKFGDVMHVHLLYTACLKTAFR